MDEIASYYVTVKCHLRKGEANGSAEAGDLIYRY